MFSRQFLEDLRRVRVILCVSGEHSRERLGVAGIRLDFLRRGEMRLRGVESPAVEQVARVAAVDLGRACVGCDRLGKPVFGLGIIGLAAPELRHPQFGRVERRVVLECPLQFLECLVVTHHEETRPRQLLPEQCVSGIGFEQSQQHRPRRFEVAAALVSRDQPASSLGLKALLPLGVPAGALRVSKGFAAVQDDIGDATLVRARICALARKTCG